MNKIVAFCSACFALAVSAVFAALPDSFVEYVESTNAATYVNTGILPNPAATRMVVKLTPTVVDSTQRGIFGSLPSATWGGTDAAYVLLASSKFRVDWIGSQTAAAFTPGTTVVYTFDMIANRAFIDSAFYASSAYKVTAAGKALYLFNMNNNGTVYTGLPQKLYASRIYTDGTTLAANYIPCVKDGVAGLYDSVSGNILYSAAAYPLKAAATPHPDIRLNAGKVEARLIITVGAGGSVDTTGTNWVEVGSTVTLTATPDAGQQAQWASTHDGATYTNCFAGNSLSFTMPGYPVAVDASFVADGYAPFVTDLTALVDAAAEGDEILLLEGTYTLTKTLTIAKAVTITGAGRDQTIIQSAPNAFIRGIYMTAPALIRDFTVTGFTNELAGSGLYMTAGTADTVRVSFNQDRRYNLYYGAGIYMTGGVVTNSLIDGNSMDSGYGSTYGVGIYMTGGLVVDSVIKDNWRARNEFYGGGVAISGAGTLLRCHIENNGSLGYGNGTSNTRGMGVYMNNANGLVDRCVIVSNDIHGVWMSAGTLRNSLVQGHKTTGAGYTAGVEMSGGTLYNCTVADNVAPASYAGLRMSNGTAVNNIVFGNGTSGDVLVSGGTFNTNLVDSLASITTSKAVGNMATDPFYVDPENGDFTIGFSSPGVDAGATVTSYAVDLVGGSRPQGAAYDLGCYEYVQAGGALQCAIIVSQIDWPSGASPTVSARVAGGSESYTYTWYVDSALSDQTSATPTFAGLSDGRHTLKLVVWDGASSAEDEYVDAIDLHPFTVYVDSEGSNTYPYDTAAKAAHAVNDAFDAVWRASSTVATLHIANGTYFLSSELALGTPCHILGAGRDATVLSGGTLSAAYRGVSITAAGSIVRDLTITGCTNILAGSGIYMTAGTADTVRVSFNRGNKYNLEYGAGIYMTGGIVTNSLIDGNSSDSGYGGMSGVGVYMSGGLLTDSEIANNWRNRNQLYGAGIYAAGGTVRRCYIHGNSNKSGGTGNDTRGMGLCLNGDNAVVENCRIEGNGKQGVYLQNGKLYNALVTGHAMPSTSYAGGIDQVGGYLYNCTLTGNTSTDPARGNLMKTSGTSVNNIIYNDASGSCLVSGGTFNTNLVDVAVATGTGNLVAVASPFANQALADYRIRSISPAFNAGNNGVWAGFTAPLDLAGIRRILLKIVDLGCYECVGGGGTVLFLH